MAHPLRDRRRIDLHMHSNRSDGRFDLDDVLARCARGGLDAVAITDHDLAVPVEPGLRTVEGRPLWVIGAAEVSGMHAGVEQHLLVYFPGDVPQAFRDFCEAQVRARVRRYEQALDNLKLPGLEPPDDLARRGERALTRHHLARGLVEAGHAKDLHEAFGRYMGRSHAFVPPLTFPFVDAIRLARSLGGVTSWAHPCTDAVREHLPELVRAGLQGLEGLRPNLTSADRRALKRSAQQHGLFLTGGSDWHGWYHDGDLGLFSVAPSDVGGFVDALEAA